MKAIHLTSVLSIILLAASCSSKQSFDAQGTFEATEVTVSAETTGKILALNIEEGDSIVAGVDVGLVDTLQLSLQYRQLAKQQEATLKQRPDIASQAAALRQQIVGAKTDRDRVSRLLERGAATQQQLDNLDTQIASLEGQLSAVMSQVNNSTASLTDQASAVELQMVSVADQLRRCHLQSPIDGVILTKYAQAGEVATFGTPLFKVADVENMYLRAYFTSDQLADLQLGQHVTVTADFGGDNTRDYDGVISFISSESEFTPKTIQTKDSRANLVYAVKIAVKNDGYLKIGLAGNVTLK